MNRVAVPNSSIKNRLGRTRNDSKESDLEMSLIGKASRRESTTGSISSDELKKV